MSTIKIEDIAFVRYLAPDLEEMRAFLVEFGMTPVPSDDGVLYARGAGSAPFVHATEEGQPAFAALGLRAESVADLELLAAAEGAKVEPFSAPGGGSVVVLTDPDGRRVEIVAGQADAAPLPLEADRPHNDAHGKARLRASSRWNEPWMGASSRSRSRSIRTPFRTPISHPCANMDFPTKISGTSALSRRCSRCRTAWQT